MTEEEEILVRKMVELEDAIKSCTTDGGFTYDLEVFALGLRWQENYDEWEEKFSTKEDISCLSRISKKCLLS